MRRILPGVLAVTTTLLALVPGIADEPKKDAKPKHTNRLAREISPYLLQHAHNPVDWYPWGPDAFAKAKKENKLIFLSIGYSSCHWCHVMERESFENEEVARLLNQWFVCIKVDREERPDIDNTYMTALHVIGGKGGWPLTMFLTPDAKPIVGGTYWPPDDKVIEGQKQRGLKSVLKLMHDLQENKAKEVQEQADTVAVRTAEELAGAVRGIPILELNRKLVDGVVDAIKDEYDSVHGGFGNPSRSFRGPKFPTPPLLALLQHEAARTKSKELAGIVQNTLDHMARGGIYDHVGGGFHRYSTERTWTVPHFEKMLYDNAQLVEVYARAVLETHQAQDVRLVNETLAFIDREMTSPEGAFYSALDADSDGEEGRFYIWTDKELETALGNQTDADYVKRVYGANGTPNFESKYHILYLPKSLADVAKPTAFTEIQVADQLQPLLKKLRETRSKRNRPFLDTKILTGWNGQMIAGYAVAGGILNSPRLTSRAERAAEFILKTLRTPDGRLLRTYAAAPGGKGEARLQAYLDDYAYLVHGLLCLHRATGNKKWLKEAQALADKMIEHYGDPKAGGFFYTANDQEKLFARSKDQYDGAQPSANSVAARNLVRLWLETKEERYRELAEKSFKAFAPMMQSNPSSMATMAEALSMYLEAKK